MPRQKTFNSSLTDPDPTNPSGPGGAGNGAGGGSRGRGGGGGRGGPTNGRGGGSGYGGGRGGANGLAQQFQRGTPPHMSSAQSTSGPRVPHPNPNFQPHSHSHVQNDILISQPVLTSVGGQTGPEAQVIVTKTQSGRGGAGSTLSRGMSGLSVSKASESGADGVETQTGGEDEDEEEAEDEEETDDDTCFICAEKITYWSVGVCGHRTCHICALRLRVFYKKTDCTFCKTQLPTLLFTSSPTTPFPSNPSRPLPFAQIGDSLSRPGTPHLKTPSGLPIASAASSAEHGHNHNQIGGHHTHPRMESPVHGQLDMSQFSYVDEKLGVVFETAEMMEATLLLLRFNCPEKTCSFMAAGWDGLEKHTLSVHGSVLCHLCRRQLSRFAHEQILYPPHLLPLHDPSKVPRGHRKPYPRGKAEEEMVEGWGNPHPMCEFCHEAFFSSEELFKHMRNRHEECFVCKERGDRDVYFQNYPKMEVHFNQAHYPCLEKECLEKKFVVFGSELDWRAHMMAEHEKNMSAKDRHQARQLPIEFIGSLPADYSFIPAEPDHNRRTQNRNTHGRVEPSNQFSRPGARARDAPQHQQLEHNQMDGERHGSRNNRAGFGATLSSHNQQGDNSGSGSRARSGANTPREDAEESVFAKHAELMGRVGAMVDFSEAKLSSFRHSVRQYKNGEAPAKDMVDTVYTILNKDSDETVKLLREVSGLMAPDEDKVQGVLAAINVFRIERQAEFPSLGAGPSSVGTEYAGIASGTVLNAKRVTQTRGNANSMWDRIEQAAVSGPVARPSKATAGPGGRKVPGATSAPAFPALGANAQAGPSRSAAAHQTPWASKTQPGTRPTASAFPPPTAIRSVHMPAASSSRPGKAPKPPSTALFPSLPPAKQAGLTSQERQALFGKSTAREDTLRRMGAEGAPPVSSNGWTTVGTGEYVPESPEDEHPPPVRQTAGKKKNKKETLFTISARP